MYAFASFSLPGSFVLPSGSGTLQARQKKQWSLKMRMMKTWKASGIQGMRTQLLRLCRGLRRERNSYARSSRLHHHISRGKSKSSLHIIGPVCAAVWLVHSLSFQTVLLTFRLSSDTVDYEDSCVIVRYLASMRPFAQSFDIYLSQVRRLILH